MNIDNSIINKLCNMDDDELNRVELKLHLVSKQVQSDNYYQTGNIELNPEVVKWLKKNIVQFLNNLKVEDENGIKKFHVSDYNFEIKKQDFIAKFELTEIHETLLERKNSLMKALNSPTSEYDENKTNFQIVHLNYEQENVYFCYYRGIKRNTYRKKYVIRNSNEFNFFDNTLLDVGGNIDFFIIDDYIFILNVTNFEYAFNYRDHINKKRDENLTYITSMSFFDSENSNPTLFAETCKQYIYSRSLAQIEPKTLKVLQSKFEDRCKELKIIKENFPEDPSKQEEYKQKFGTVWELLDYIDTENYKVIYNEGLKPTPLIHFFADKIVKSFLTSDFKVATAFER